MMFQLSGFYYIGCTWRPEYVLLYEYIDPCCDLEPGSIALRTQDTDVGLVLIKDSWIIKFVRSALAGRESLLPSMLPLGYYVWWTNFYITCFQQLAECAVFLVCSAGYRGSAVGCESKVRFMWALSLGINSHDQSPKSFRRASECLPPNPFLALRRLHITLHQLTAGHYNPHIIHGGCHYREAPCVVYRVPDHINNIYARANSSARPVGLWKHLEL